MSRSSCASSLCLDLNPFSSEWLSPLAKQQIGQSCCFLFCGGRTTYSWTVYSTYGLMCSSVLTATKRKLYLGITIAKLQNIYQMCIGFKNCRLVVPDLVHRSHWCECFKTLSSPCPEQRCPLTVFEHLKGEIASLNLLQWPPIFCNKMQHSAPNLLLFITYTEVMLQEWESGVYF